MLDDPAASTVMRRFHGEFFHFDLFTDITKTGVSNFNAAIGPELTESSYLFFDKIFTKGLGVKDIFTATTGFVGPKMAAIYGSGVTAPGAGTYTEQNLGANRVGYFMQLPFLMFWGKNGEPDSIHRGVRMNLDVMCAKLGPPALAVPMLPQKDPGETNRQLVDNTTAGCGMACHNEMINPIDLRSSTSTGWASIATSRRTSPGRRCRSTAAASTRSSMARRNTRAHRSSCRFSRPGSKRTCATRRSCRGSPCSATSSLRTCRS